MICFVILHYMIVDETVGCIDSIKSKIKSEKKIVVVDNKSPNDSGEELRKRYENDDEVVVVINSHNAGFASGNNLGFKYAKDSFDPDYIIVMNNDVEIVQDDFMEIVCDEYEKNGFDIMGPDIYSTSYKLHQSPKRTKGYEYDEIVKLNRNYKAQLTDNLFTDIKCAIKNITPLRMYVYRKRRARYDYTQELTDVILHGACVIYSPDYLKKYDFAFVEGTFFYYEMEILEYFCRINHLRTLYCPRLKVEHHQNVSTNVAYKNMKDKTMFANKCNYDSTAFFIRYMKDNPPAGRE